jgi:hypothetical protein
LTRRGHLDRNAPLGLGDVQEWPRCAVGLVPPSFEGDLDYVPLLAGESCGVVIDITPAAQIVTDLVRDAEAALAR